MVKETVIETVEMEDGSIVEFAGKRRMLKSSTIDDAGNISTRLDFRNGRVITFLLPQSLKDQAAAHGIEQKLGDETASLPDIDDAVTAVEALCMRLSEGQWNAQREASPFAGQSILIKALCEHTGKAPEAIKEFLANKTQAEKIALRANPKIRPIVQRLEDERNAKQNKVDTDALLGELE